MGSERIRLGIDVGGTNTDAVLMRGKTVLATTKSFTTGDVRDGVIAAVRDLLAVYDGAPSDIEAVMIGTTQFVNAFVQRRDLSPVAAIRVGLPAGDGVPPFSGWPDDALAAVDGQYYLAGGGAFFSGQDYAPLDEDAVAAAASDAAAKGISAFAISATFAPIRPDLEIRAAAVVRAAVPDARITLSAEVGGIGIIDRENAAIVNASLAALATRVVGSLRRAFADLGITAPLFISQNDGTLISTGMAERLPILTCSAGPTNSIRGAAFLSGLDDAIVADIGGTTSDIGFLRGGFPRETTSPNTIGGVRTNFRMPDVLSIGVGGGSVVLDTPGGVTVGPRSVGYRLPREGRVFGGETLTATDIAVCAGRTGIGDASRVAGVPAALVESALDSIHQQIEDAIDQIKVSSAPQPLILVGGGNILVSRPIRGASQVLRPPHAEVANAVGAAIALVSGRVDKLYDFAALGRAAALEQARKDAIAQAVAGGAEAGKVEVVDLLELPMTHMKSGSVQVKVRAVGPLAALA
ncbi:hydantoinase/oxoprolinase family protein [Novosphingobium album (ex Hu et al. 2023)]|uniref:Hydantoinase/oxoprolinase family protein n=1 Tax=Novosphingobium album (ex Hu et al. 2023) TaxID=2930093 RepID=A0ABT0B7D9_9SPHN|nr:hydantoinase/oxoprolinase family protein [Novosphingobium album (ex Hu et al. 2023)]MCJ2180949.1 hydantoinase/oxoprolinase family protein [Novosphingobium album (ex Hu et al. 2023)]